MAIDLSVLPRQTAYAIQEIAFDRDLVPVFGGPETRVRRLGTRHAIRVSIPALAAAGCGPALVADLSRGRSESVSVIIPEPGVNQDGYGAAVVSGAGQLGSTLNVGGLTPGVVIPKGKWFNVTISGRRFAYFTTAEVTASGGGTAALPLYPMIRRSAPNGATVTLSNPRLEGLVLTPPEWDVRRIGAIGIEFTVRERE